MGVESDETRPSVQVSGSSRDSTPGVFRPVADKRANTIPAGPTNKGPHRRGDSSPPQCSFPLFLPPLLRLSSADENLTPRCDVLGRICVLERF